MIFSYMQGAGLSAVGDARDLHTTTPLSCFVRRFEQSTKSSDQQCQSRRVDRKSRYALHLLRAPCTYSHNMCYRGLHLQFPCASTRVDLNVIPFLERQIIWFLLVSLRPSALAVIFSCALGLRNPSAFFSCCLHTHAFLVTYCFFFPHRCLHPLWVGSSCFCFSFVAILCCLCSQCALVSALILLINQKAAYVEAALYT